MIVEMRSYSLVPGRVAEFLALYESKGWRVQSQLLGHCIGYFSTEFGDVNGVIHLWAFDDLQDRAQRRAALSADKDWSAFLQEVAPMLSRMESTLLRPAPFALPKPLMR